MGWIVCGHQVATIPSDARQTGDNFVFYVDWAG
jgi:hypothetical protein